MRRLEGLTVLMAGGSGGIGSATSKRFASEGAKVVVGSVRQEGVNRVVDEIRELGGEALGVYLNLEDDASIAEAFAEGTAKFGPILRLFCNGAIVGEAQKPDTDALGIDLAFWEHTLRVNLTGYLSCIKQALPAMLEAKDGSIVTISSGASYTPEDVRVAYGVSKAGINHLMRHVAQRWGKQGIRANAVVPGFVKTPATKISTQTERLFEAGRSPRLGEPEDIAAMAAMLMSKDGEWVNGQIIAVDGGLTLRQ